jgi:hypothetical protein
VPQRSPDFAHLPLVGLRKYRRALTEEESRVSYWRRIIQARLDMVRATEKAPSHAMDSMRPVLTEARVGRGRQSLIEIVPMNDVPPLPNLEALWDRDFVPGDDEMNADLIDDLVKAEAQLSAYRAALHRRISGATTELIARYREDPSQCLSALPLPRERTDRRASTG